MTFALFLKGDTSNKSSDLIDNSISNKEILSNFKLFKNDKIYSQRCLSICENFPKVFDLSVRLHEYKQP